MVKKRQRRPLVINKMKKAAKKIRYVVYIEINFILYMISNRLFLKKVLNNVICYKNNVNKSNLILNIYLTESK